MSEPAVATKVTVRIDPLVRARLAREAAAERRPIASMAKLLIEDATRFAAPPRQRAAEIAFW